MIGQLRGTLAARLPNNHVIVDCGGVGYEVACSGYTLAALPEVDAPVTLRVFTHAQENKIALYGFFTTAERELFDYLITVKNVGPSTAMAILSGGAEPRAIAELIAKEDTAGLTKIKGVGKKTAELLVVELREKCELLLLSWNAAGGPRPVAAVAGARRGRHPMLDEVAAALVGLGWKPLEAEAAVGELAVGPGITLEMLVRAALRNMPR
ncbi:MAG: Holliday junction branch migration protein RuvA [Kofleriaceae bacterium]|jgi:Holliday junction DNA helicase RuvA|nr:Holliday junction branch migration protein RuvA [Kofleriaceae bacterium]MBP9166997.1 Holliday junction branch migration protein RuvA [Kofleriaceae bacterium]MBP9858308.1 Holliday junction branch migration protein RuvA [Kofleriaceae bacterium]